MNPSLLHQALQDAKLPVVACDSTGNITYSRELTGAEQNLAANVITSSPERELQATEIEQAQQMATTQFQNLPVWMRTFTADDVANYIATNVTNLESAKIALTHIGKMLIVIRDFIKLRA